MKDTPRQIRAPAWAGPVLWLAACYNLAWGAWVIFFPNAFFRIVGMEPPSYPQIWQCLGMVVGVYGVGYAIAASDPFRHWPILFVGWLGKVLGPFGTIQNAWLGKLPWKMLYLNLTNDFIWWIPFTVILVQAYRSHSLLKRHSP